jgi:hypothetical protein
MIIYLGKFLCSEEITTRVVVIFVISVYNLVVEELTASPSYFGLLID